MSSSKKIVQLLKEIEPSFIEAAKHYKISVRQLTSRQWVEFNTGRGICSERKLRAAGGFGTLKPKFFKASDRLGLGLPDHPLATEAVKKMKGHELSEHVAKVIGSCAAELGIHPHELTWLEFAKFINFRFGKNDYGIAKHTIHRAGGFNQIRDAYFPSAPTPVTVDKRRLLDQARLNRKLGEQSAKQHFIIDRLEDFTQSFVEQMKALPPAGNACFPKPKPMKRVLTLALSDCHFGSDLDPSESGHSYGKVEEARRLAAVVKQTALYKFDHREETELEVLLLGDLIQGILHDPADGAAQAEQMIRCLFLLRQAISFLSTQFSKVRVRCATGNHGRFKSRHKERAVNQKWDSAETMIYASLKLACDNLKNVEFFIPKTPFVTYEALGHSIFATHGDTVLNPGYPGKSIPTGSLETQTNKINASIRNSGKEYSVFIVGHVHTGSLTYMGNGSVVLTNAALTPIGPHAVSIGIFESQCGQWLFESTEAFACGDARLLVVNADTDKDASLDSIIKPWESL